VHRIIFDALLVLVLLQKLRCGGPKPAVNPNAVNLCITDLVYPLSEQFLRLIEVTCSSAFANSRSSEHLVDMPDPAALGEACSSLVSHGLLRKERAARHPLRLLYSSARA